MSQSSFVLFMHIPKAAGTTLRSIVDAQYGRATVLTHYNQNNRQLLDNLPYMLMDRRWTLRALIGHFPFGIHRGIARPVRYVTFLREPVNRVIAAYHENLKTDPARLTREDGTVMSLGEAIQSRSEAYVNQQLKMLAGLPADAPATEADVHAVERTLAEQFEFVGTMERYDQSVLLLSKRLGWRPCLYGRLNQARAAPVVETGVLAALADRNRLERRIYDRAAHALDEAIAAEGPAFAAAHEELDRALGARQARHGGASEAVLVDADTLPKVASYLSAR